MWCGTEPEIERVHGKRVKLTNYQSLADMSKTLTLTVRELGL